MLVCTYMSALFHRHCVGLWVVAWLGERGYEPGFMFFRTSPQSLGSTFTTRHCTLCALSAGVWRPLFMASPGHGFGEKYLDELFLRLHVPHCCRSNTETFTTQSKRMPTAKHSQVHYTARRNDMHLHLPFQTICELCKVSMLANHS